jgi:D-xylose transport system substrate-binding protein
LKRSKSITIIIGIIIFLAVLLSAFFIFFSKNKSGEKTNNDKIVIGFSMDTLAHERWLRDKEILVTKANELGAEVVIQTANSNSAEQEKQVNYLLDQNIDVLVFVPHDKDTAANIIKNAKNKGVKVISYDRLAKKANADLYISFDGYKVGQLMGQAALENIPSGNYLILNGSKTDNNAFMLNEGYKKVLNESINSGKIKIINEIWIANWLYENALSVVESTLNSNKNIDAIIAGNDTLAGAAINALSEKRLAGKITVVGQDADLDGCQRVVEGTQNASVYKPIETLAKVTAEYAVKLAKGESIKTPDTINDGKYEIPYYKIEPVLVTKNNMVDVIIKNQFHLLEEVYMNVPKSQWPKQK